MQRQLVRELVVAHLPLGFCLAPFGALPIFSAGRKTCSACQVVYQLADGAGKPKLLLDDGFGLPDGIWTRRLPQEAMANSAGRTASRPIIWTWLQCTSFGIPADAK